MLKLGHQCSTSRPPQSSVRPFPLRTGQPFDVPAEHAFYKRCDAMMLRLMADDGASIASVFTGLFKNNPIDRIFRFLDEESTPIETLALIASLS